ncbi:unnamed protein product [Somion occarium]|uniref:Uncharacterized protein n=1 Tax=Somion occarium TaxID=3059160 RepID=A0ABP1CN53_9APHY
MVCAVSPVPAISISPAPPQEPTYEPFSPFSPFSEVNLKEPDSPRPALLSPPPVLSPRSPRQLSPLRPSDAPVHGQGLERDRFEALLRASRERNSAVGGKRSPDLRKEIALKVHKSKQVERRALFLSKVLAPPSPTATLVPKTPPESPAIFHYSLPSPGLESPIAVFETLALENPYEPPRYGWVEQVDYRIQGQEYIKPMPRSASMIGRKYLPSLDEITARLSFQGHVSAKPESKPRFSARLPSFLNAEAKAPESPKPRRPPPIAVGRLQFPFRSNSPPALVEEKMEIHSPAPCFPPPSPSAVPTPTLQVVTTVVPRTSSKSPSEFTEHNLKAFVLHSRERTARDMLSRLRRRTLTFNAESSVSVAGSKNEERKLRRHSAPPELPLRERRGFTQPVLNLPGAF